MIHYRFFVPFALFVSTWFQQESIAFSSSSRPGRLALQGVIITTTAQTQTQIQATSTLTSTTQLDMTATPSAISSLSPIVDGKKSDGGAIAAAAALSSEELQAKLQGKRVALYFSAGWCPMCTSFEPALQQFKQAAAESEQPMEFIYVSSDRSESDALKRAAQMGMMSVPFDQTADYKKKYKIWAGSESIKFGFLGRRSGVPALVVLDNKEGDELAFLATESQGVNALGNWPLDDEANGIW